MALLNDYRRKGASPAASPLRAALDAQTSEREFQQAVVNLARLCGWRCYHTFRADRSPAGFPDLVLVRDGRLIFAELKRQSGKPTPEQVAWLEELGEVAERAGGHGNGRAWLPNVAAYLWRPADWPEIERVLTERD